MKNRLSTNIIQAIAEESSDEDVMEVTETNVVSRPEPKSQETPKKPLTPLKKPKQASIFSFFGKKK